MGTTYVVANATKKQFFDPADVGGFENTKRSGILWGLSGHGLAQLLMPDCRLEFYLESWIGDSIFLAGDESNTIELLKQIDPDPNQNSYQIAIHNFDNITLNLIAFLCRRVEVLDEFLELADRHPSVFINLAHLITHLRCRHIEFPFVERFGPKWQSRYVEVLKSIAWHHPLPMTPETRQQIVPHILNPRDVRR